MRGSTSCTNFTRLSDSNHTNSAANACLPRVASRFSKTPFAIESIGTSAGRDNEVCCIRQAEKFAIAPGLLAHHKFIAQHKSIHITGQSSPISGTALCTHTSSLDRTRNASPCRVWASTQKASKSKKGIQDRLLAKLLDLLQFAQKVGHNPLHILDSALNCRLYNFCGRHLLDTQRPPIQLLTNMQFRFVGPMQKQER